MKSSPAFRHPRWRRMAAVSTAALVVSTLGAGVAVADDGPMVRKDVTKTPAMESEDAQLSMLQFHVPATKADGTATTIDYFADLDGDNQPDAEGEPVETRDRAKPLVVSYYDEVEASEGNASGGGPDTAIVTGIDPEAGDVGIMSGGEPDPALHRDAWASFSLDDGETWKETNLSESALESSFKLENGIEFPGDVVEVKHAVAGNQILVAWVSKYCDAGSPRYAEKDEAGEPVYEDLFDVAGNQGSIDYAEYQHHGEYPYVEVGEIPFSCVWTARGTVEQLVNPQTGLEQWGVQWRKAERLTSGKRDAFYLAVDGAEDAGFALAWQEDPEGLRPGSGEGPGVGWSGATVNHKTDIWYSHIAADDFAAVDTTDQDVETNKPKVAEQMSMPVRVSDNYNCLTDRVDDEGVPSPPYCFADLDGDGDDRDLTRETYPWTNSKGETLNIGVTEDGRLLNGQTGASRARMEIQPYTKADGSTSAWVVLTYEETKGLGSGNEDIEPLDIGKDVMYHSFDLVKPELAAPGTMLSMPETDPAGDPENPTFLPTITNDKGEQQYQTSIGRRPSLLVQPTGTVEDGGVSAVVLYKDGLDNQGGPADIFMRRLVVPSEFDPQVDNPYDVANLTCSSYDTAIVGTSPSAYPASAYPNGVCLDGEVNLSSSTPLTFEPLDNGDPDHGITQRVLTYTQSEGNLDDETWVNGYEVAKGHRGFIDGDFLMVMYAYSPNWLATSHGNEPYNLYIRRSFDGGETWTTTPADLGGDGTTYEQLVGVGEDATVETRTLGAGEFEPARNVSQLTSSKETVLDPRYSPTNIGTQKAVTRELVSVDENGVPTYAEFTEYDDVVRDPSRFFAVYETGDATTVELGGEAEPLDLFFSRATDYGDEWDVESVTNSSTGEEEERWDWLENDKEVLSGEASIAASPGGDFMWAVWNQWEEDAEGHIFNSDPVFRRLWWADDVESTTLASAPSAVTTATWTVSYEATSEELESVELWVKVPDATSYELADTDTGDEIDGKFTYKANAGEGKYRFYTVGVSEDGDELPPVVADAVTTYTAVVTPPPPGDPVDPVDPVDPETPDPGEAETDETAPASRATSPRFNRTGSIKVTYVAKDEAGGSGLAKVELYAKAPGATAFTKVATDTGAGIDRVFAYTAAAGEGAYRFYTVATDLAGNVEVTPAEADTTTALDKTPAVVKRRMGKGPFALDLSDRDKLALRLRINERSQVTMLIRDTDGLVRQFGPNLTAKGLVTRYWNGRDADRKQVEPGRYVLVVKVKDMAGNTTTLRTRLRVTR